MGRSVIEAMGIERETAQEMVNAFDAMDRRSMIELSTHYDPAIPPHENQPYIDAVNEVRDVWQKDLNAEMTGIRERAEPEVEAEEGLGEEPDADGAPA